MSPLRSLWYRVNYTEALVDRPRRVLLDWSAKAGCTVAIKMYLRYLGLLAEAEHYSNWVRENNWVHVYRVRVYYANHGLATHRDLTDPGLVKIKVVRNPYDRAVSSYIAAVRHRLDEIVDLAGKGAGDLSFRRFLELLESIDLSACNPHYRTQVRPYETGGVTFDAILHLERLSEDLAELNRRHGIALDPAGLTSHHHIKKTDRVMHGAADAPWPALADSIPAYASFYDPDTLRRVERLYRLDFAHYGYAMNPSSGAIGDEPRGGPPSNRYRYDVRGLSYGVCDAVRYLSRPLQLSRRRRRRLSTS